MPAIATRLLPEPVGVASTTWSPAARASAASSWCGYSGRPELGRPRGERVEHVQRVGTGRREELGELGHHRASVSRRPAASRCLRLRLVVGVSYNAASMAPTSAGSLGSVCGP